MRTDTERRLLAELMPVNWRKAVIALRQVETQTTVRLSDGELVRRATPIAKRLILDSYDQRIADREWSSR